MSTHRRRLRGGPPNAGGYRALAYGPGEPHVVRDELVGATPTPPRSGGGAEVLLSLAHLSDLHVCDHQSPARVEILDRFADPDAPVDFAVEDVGTYRAQEGLTAHVVDAMVRSVNAVAAGPVGGGTLELAIITGDLTDNAQANELDWYLSLLDGGRVRPDSGDLNRYEGVADDVEFDERFWHPDSVWPDLPRTKFGFPQAPGLLDAARAPFDAPGLQVPWLSVHGNHDQLVQGTLAPLGVLGRFMTGTRKPARVPSHWSADEVVTVLTGLAANDLAALGRLRDAAHRRVTADPRRRAVTRAEFVAAHFRAGARPAGHGFTAGAGGDAFYRHDHGQVTLLVLDTVNEEGGWEGSLDLEQLAWLRAELDAADRERRYVVLGSHHPLRHLVNGYSTGGRHRVLVDELTSALNGHPSLVLWLNGHTHRTTTVAHPTWWEVTAPSLIDWPQQGRIVEILRHDGMITVATTMIDHAGDAPWGGDVDGVDAIAGLSRELAANDWQTRRAPLEAHPRGGPPGDRNALLHLPDPFASAGERSRYPGPTASPTT